MTPRDWPTFWQSLTPEECADALRSAPRVAGEWEAISNGTRTVYARTALYRPCSSKCGYMWEKFAVSIGLRVNMGEGDRECFVFGGDVRSKFADSIEAAKSAADAALRDAGWILL